MRETRQASILGEYLGSGCVTEATGIVSIHADGEGLRRAIKLALADAGLQPDAVGMIIAHGNGTRASDASEAAAILQVFGKNPPPVTAFKWAFGHLLAASGMLDVVLALRALCGKESCRESPRYRRRIRPWLHSPSPHRHRNRAATSPLSTVAVSAAPTSPCWCARRDNRSMPDGRRPHEPRYLANRSLRCCWLPGRAAAVPKRLGMARPCITCCRCAAAW